MKVGAQHLLVVRFGETQTPNLEATLLAPTSADLPKVVRLPTFGAHRTSRAPDTEYSWLVGKTAKKIAVDSNNWVKIDLGEENPQLGWQLRTGLFLEAAAAFRAPIDALDRRVDVVAVGRAVTGQSAASGKPTIWSRRPPGWLRLVLERVGWSGRVTVCDALPRGAEAVFDTGPAALPASIRYTALVEKLREMNAPQVHFGQRRIGVSLGFIKSQTAGVGLAQRIVTKGEPLPVRSEVRLVMDEADVAARELAFHWRPADDDGMFRIVLGIAKELGGSPFATIPAHLLTASDPNGGVRLILEIDRFGRCYMTLRDEFDRLISVVTPHPSSSDGSAWSAGDPKMAADWKEDSRKCPANRIFLGNLLFEKVAGASLQGWERLPGAMAATSFNGQPCEEYHLELRSRHRQGATIAGYEQDVSDALELHMQRWSEPNRVFLDERILKGPYGSTKCADQISAAIGAVIDCLPQDMHHFRALLLSLPGALERKGFCRE